MLLVAVTAAREQVAIMTPCFVPPRELVGALEGDALRGVDVAVIIPGRNDRRLRRARRHLRLARVVARWSRPLLQPGRTTRGPGPRVSLDGSRDRIVALLGMSPALRADGRIGFSLPQPRPSGLVVVTTPQRARDRSAVIPRAASSCFPPKRRKQRGLRSTRPDNR
ncbi:MAG TPA: phospholipase D-like domain-containing protein [Thermoanaerobaculia bacterium]|nr:phospholipase D-like domain-containing protein [Thermoanaerobaculia bacterium]